MTLTPNGGLSGSRRCASLVLAAIALQSACSSRSTSRAELQDVTSIHVASSDSPDGGLSLGTKEQIGPLVAELNDLRKRKWKNADVLFPCHASLVIYKNREAIAVFRVGGRRIVDRYMNDQQSTNNLVLADSEAPRLKEVLSRLMSPENCR